MADTICLQTILKFTPKVKFLMSLDVVANCQPLCFGQAGSAPSQIILQMTKLVVEKVLWAGEVSKEKRQRSGA